MFNAYVVKTEYLYNCSNKKKISNIEKTRNKKENKSDEIFRINDTHKPREEQRNKHKENRKA